MKPTKEKGRMVIVCRFPTGKAEIVKLSNWTLNINYIKKTVTIYAEKYERSTEKYLSRLIRERR